MAWKPWQIGVAGACVVAAVASGHGDKGGHADTAPRGSDRELQQQMDQLGRAAARTGTQGTNESDESFCNRQADAWAAEGMPWSNDNICNGKDMGYWRAHRPQGT